MNVYVLLTSVRAFCRFIILFCPNTKQTHVKRGTMSQYEMKEVRAAGHAVYDISFAGNRTQFSWRRKGWTHQKHILLPCLLPALRNEDGGVWLCLELACVKSISFQYSMFPLFGFILCPTARNPQLSVSKSLPVWSDSDLRERLSE